MLENANQSQENQIAAIRRFIAYKVDVIAFSPIVEDGWDNVLMEAKEAGIPVILVDRDIETSMDDLTTCLIGADFYNEGVMARHPEYIAQCDSLGMSSNVWTVNNPDYIDAFRAGGVHAITTDVPMTARERLGDEEFCKK